eukprot:10027414-Ditylum_brightwellii.AAC.1
MKAQDESTSLSPSGYHDGHYKAVLDKSNLCLVHAQMMSMAWLAGFTPSRWEKVIDCMLEKDPGKSKIDYLHLIVIVEGDMNGTLKFIWNHRLVPVAGKKNFLSPLQFGNRKGCTALDALLLTIALGMPENAMKASVLLNHKAKHHVKTKAGVTTEYYQSTKDCPSYTEDQWKGSSFSNWLFQ